MTKSDGDMLMAPAAGEGGGSSTSKRHSDGVLGYPAVGGSNGGKGKPPHGTDRPRAVEPLPVVLAKGTFFKFGILLFGTMLVGISGVLIVYWNHHYRAVHHMKDGSIHMKSGERGKFETKVEAKKARKELETDIKKHFDLKTGQLQLKNAKQITKIGKQLRTEQRVQYRRILSEIKKTN